MMLAQIVGRPSAIPTPAWRNFSPLGSVSLVWDRGFAVCHANAMQNILFCMAGFRPYNNFHYFLNFWRARRDSNS